MSKEKNLTALIYDFANEVEHLRGYDKVERRHKFQADILKLVPSEKEIEKLIKEDFTENIASLIRALVVKKMKGE